MKHYIRDEKKKIITKKRKGNKSQSQQQLARS
jgi:hypothetical protein